MRPALDLIRQLLLSSMFSSDNAGKVSVFVGDLTVNVRQR